MALDLTFLNGTGDGSNTFTGSPFGTIGQILAGDSGPTSIYQSEFQGLGASTTVVLQTNRNITLDTPFPL